MRRLRLSLILALAGLALVLAFGAPRPEPAQPASAAVLLAEKDGIRLFAGEAPPEGALVVYDRDTLYQGLLVYVCPEVPLPADVPAQQSRDVRSMVRLYIPAAERVALSEETIYALCALVRQNPLVHTWIMAGMRSPKEQEALQKAAFTDYQATMPMAQAFLQALRDVPDSGKSEHQLATCFDVRLNGVHAWSIEDPMAQTEDGRWLLQNAWRFGFIRRYPPEKAHITGVKNEALHWRYVGAAHAAAMHALDCTLEEYLQLLHAQGTLRLTDDAGGEHWLICRPMAETAAFPAPAGYTARPSADNLGYAVCVLSRDQ